MSSDEGAREGPFYLSWVIYPKGSERVLFREVPKVLSFLISDLWFTIYFIDPKLSEAVLFRKVIQCSKRIGFCSIRFMWYPSESYFFRGGGQGAVSGEEQSVEIDFGRLPPKYQCWGKWGAGVGGYRFIQVGERFWKSTIPGHSKRVHYSERLWKSTIPRSSERLLFWKDWVSWCPIYKIILSASVIFICVCVCGGGVGRKQ